MKSPLLTRIHHSLRILRSRLIARHPQVIDGDIAQFFGSDHPQLSLNGELFENTTASIVAEDHELPGVKKLTRLTGAFWTAGQRQASSLHEISYRACFKPQLPRYFIKRFTNENDIVYDPFSGRGTSVIEAGLMGRRVVANDANPVSQVLAQPRLQPPTVAQVEERLAQIKYRKKLKADIDLSMFYHADTEAEIVALKRYLARRKAEGEEDVVDRWIRMVATNRLTGHSPGFFSVYTFPPNQAVSAESQRRINQKRNQTPEYRDTKSVIAKKSAALLKNVSAADRERLNGAAHSARFLADDARRTKAIKKNSVQLTVTSPPFLDTVGYASDNWLRCWFNDIDLTDVTRNLTMAKTIDEWSSVMSGVFDELYRITKRGGWVAFEVGEIRKGQLKLEEYVVPLGIAAGFSCVAVMINSQAFTKTSHIWGVKNNSGGINSNRVAIFRRD